MCINRGLLKEIWPVYVRQYYKAIKVVCTRTYTHRDTCLCVNNNFLENDQSGYLWETGGKSQEGKGQRSLFNFLYGLIYSSWTMNGFINKKGKKNIKFLWNLFFFPITLKLISNLYQTDVPYNSRTRKNAAPHSSSGKGSFLSLTIFQA